MIHWNASRHGGAITRTSLLVAALGAMAVSLGTLLAQGPTSAAFYKDTFDMFNFDILHKFTHSGLASLTAPRAFMIEIGSTDGIEIEPRRFVDAEMARWHNRRNREADRCHQTGLVSGS